MTAPTFELQTTGLDELRAKAKNLAAMAGARALPGGLARSRLASGARHDSHEQGMNLEAVQAMDHQLSRLLETGGDN